MSNFGYSYGLKQYVLIFHLICKQVAYDCRLNLLSACAYFLQCSSRDYSTKCQYCWLQRLAFYYFHWSSVDSLNPGKIFVKQFFSSRESFHCPSHLLAQYYSLSIVFLNLHFKVAELSTVFKCLCLIHHYFLAIYTCCPFFAKGKVTQWKVFWCILARVCVAVDEAERIKNVSCLFKRNPVVWFFHHLSTTTSHESLLSTLVK